MKRPLKRKQPSYRRDHNIEEADGDTVPYRENVGGMPKKANAPLARQRMAKYVDKRGQQRDVPYVSSRRTASPPARPQGEARAQQLADFLLENDLHIRVRNRHNGKEYPAVGMHWPEHGWSFQIHDTGEEVWGRASSGVGTGSVIDQGFQTQLEQRGWEFPALEAPPNVRDRALGDMMAKMQGGPPNPS